MSILAQLQETNAKSAILGANPVPPVSTVSILVQNSASLATQAVKSA